MKDILSDSAFQKRLLWLNGILPLFLILIDLYQNNLGANPPEAIIRTTGVVSIIFLVLTLAVTPLSHLWNQSWMIKHRRWLGLFSFYYALVHLLSYIIFDKNMRFDEIFLDISKRPFILLGFLGFLILIPLAITSTNNMIKKLGGKRWKKLHWLTYLVAPVVTMHYWLIVKSDLFYPAIVASFFIVLLSYRLFFKLIKNNK